MELLEKILDETNLNIAFKRVKSNKGKHGVDGMKVDELLPYLKTHGAELKAAIMNGTYRPTPVRRVEIPKPDGGIRLLGIPTVIDRGIQQAISQILNPIFELEFSDSSFGYRPNRSATQAAEKCRQYINEGHTWVVDIDLAKYFDTVNHDKLMQLLSSRITDSRVLSLIRKYLQSGVMIGGLVSPTEEGTPQGGNLSPLLSNVMLHELDKELEKRNLKFCRYADDCNIYVKSQKAANRVMEGVTKFIEQNLKLKVNQEKSKVDRPWKLKFLGFSFYHAKNKGYRLRAHPKSVGKFKKKLHEITGRNRSTTVSQKITQLKQVIVGWINFFKIADIKTICSKLDQWLRRRIRAMYWKRWKRVKTKYNNLKKLGIKHEEAIKNANSRKKHWRMSKTPIINIALSNEKLKKQGFPEILGIYLKSA